MSLYFSSKWQQLATHFIRTIITISTIFPTMSANKTHFQCPCLIYFFFINTKSNESNKKITNCIKIKKLVYIACQSTTIRPLIALWYLFWMYSVFLVKRLETHDRGHHAGEYMEYYVSVSVWPICSLDHLSPDRIYYSCSTREFWRKCR